MKPSLYFLPQAYADLMAYTRLCSTEISGYGLVEVAPGRRGFIVTELFLPKQQCTGGSADISGEGLGELTNWLILQGRDSDIEKLKFCWHSHVQMSVNFSTIDDTHFNSCDRFGWLLSAVTNQKGEIGTRLDIYNPVHIIINDLPVAIDVAITAEREAELAALVQENVTKPVYTHGSYVTNYNSYLDYSNGGKGMQTGWESEYEY